jgi:hypothetical protein
MEATSSTSLRSRRALIAAGLGGLAATAAHALGRPLTTRAGHDATNVLHLGESNTAPADAVTRVETDVDSNAFVVRNASTAATAGPTIRGLGSGGSPVIQAECDGPAAAISGVSSGPGFGEAGQFGLGGDAGVQGISGSGVGVVGQSQSGPGVSGHSASGVGGEFSSESGFGLTVGGPAHVGGFAPDFSLGVDNENTGLSGGGIYAISRGGKPAVEGDAFESGFSPGVGVQGVSGGNETFGQGPGVGVQGISGTGIGVQAISSDGMALDVVGKARFSTAGSASVAAGQNTAVVANSAATASSHVSVTLVGDPGPRQLRWVQRSPGVGFTVHFSGGPPGQRPQVPFTYLIVEPA